MDRHRCFKVENILARLLTRSLHTKRIGDLQAAKAVDVFLRFSHVAKRMDIVAVGPIRYRLALHEDGVVGIEGLSRNRIADRRLLGGRIGLICQPATPAQAIVQKACDVPSAMVRSTRRAGLSSCPSISQVSDAP